MILNAFLKPHKRTLQLAGSIDMKIVIASHWVYIIMTRASSAAEDQPMEYTSYGGATLGRGRSKIQLIIRKQNCRPMSNNSELINQLPELSLITFCNFNTRNVRDSQTCKSEARFEVESRSPFRRNFEILSCRTVHKQANEQLKMSNSLALSIGNTCM